jgi:hypothetical protein
MVSNTMAATLQTSTVMSLLSSCKPQTAMARVAVLEETEGEEQTDLPPAMPFQRVLTPGLVAPMIVLIVQQFKHKTNNPVKSLVAPICGRLAVVNQVTMGASATLKQTHGAVDSLLLASAATHWQIINLIIRYAGLKSSQNSFQTS